VIAPLSAFPSPATATSALTAGDALDPVVFGRLRQRAMLDGCKWDPQVGDTATLASFPLLLDRRAWQEIADASEQLAAETLALETAVLARPELLAELGLPRAVRRALQAPGPLGVSAGRVMRFDFHPTADGWRLSEVNSDVPGGYPEASHFTQLMAEKYPGCAPAGDPAAALADALAAAAGPGELVALLAAPGYMEDQQIVSFLAQQLEARGRRATLANPTQLTWTDGRADLAGCGAVAALVRFYQAEWLARLPRRFGWHHFFRGGLTPVANPGLATISESKRLPLLWDRLGVAVPTWRRWLPETRDPRAAPWFRDEGWIVKSAYSNTGDTVGHRSLRPRAEWREMCLAAWLNPRGWIAQRRFESQPIATPAGPRHACIGVYTVDGRAAGAYARLAPRPLIDFEAIDAALLIPHAD
jgi:glutathionylspermidine synthase